MRQADPFRSLHGHRYRLFRAKHPPTFLPPPNDFTDGQLIQAKFVLFEYSRIRFL